MGYIQLDNYKTALENSQTNRRKCLEECYNSGIAKLNKHDFDEDMGISQLFVLDEILCPHQFFLTSRFGCKIYAEELSDVFTVFMALNKEINKHIPFVPTISTFCNFMVIGKKAFANLCEENTERGQMARYINETLADRYMQAMISNKLPAIPAIFVAKSNYGMRDNENASITLTIEEKPKTIEEIMSEFKENLKLT